MMLKALGPVWHQKQKKAGVIPARLRGLDTEATWSFSKADHWVYGHGSFCITSHDIPVVLIFQWMRNSANEAKRMRQAIWNHCDQIKYVCMDSKADDQQPYFDLKKSGVQLLNSPRRGMNKTRGRRKMIKELGQKSNRAEYKKRSVTVEPMQGLLAAIFELDRCWARGVQTNRWMFAAMGISLQEAQLRAYRLGKSTWSVSQEVQGL